MPREWLVKLRDNKRKTHEEVADLCLISRQYYSMIENGTRNPSVEVAKKIGEVLGFNWVIFFEVQGNEMMLSS